MIDRFEKLTAGVTCIYKSIQKIKRHRMDALGLKGTHVMCLHYLSEHPDGSDRLLYTVPMPITKINMAAPDKVAKPYTIFITISSWLKVA